MTLLRQLSRRFYAVKRASIIGVSEGSLSNTGHQSFLEAVGAKGKASEAHLYISDEASEAQAFVGLGDGQPDQVRKACARGFVLLKSLGPELIRVDTMGHVKAAAEGITLASYKYDMKTEAKNAFCPSIEPIKHTNGQREWDLGVAGAQCQNLARTLSDTPANLMTPKMFCDKVTSEVEKLPIKVQVMEAEEIRSNGMECFWAVSKGSTEPPRLLVLTYNGAVGKKDYDLALVGKGVTFDSGGISLKPSKGMMEMKHDMAGAASVVSAIIGAARTGAELNMVAVTPLCENMPGGGAVKPGDVVKSLSGLTVEVEDTDAEGRLILADALSYTCKAFSPKHVVDVATLTGAMCVAVGPFASGVYASNEDLWSRISQASSSTGDLVWRMPLWQEYDKLLESCIADLKNLGGRDGGANSAARFIQRFLPAGQSWAHLDIAPVMAAPEYYGIKHRATGRPTRLLIDLAHSLCT